MGDEYIRNAAENTYTSHTLAKAAEVSDRYAAQILKSVNEPMVCSVPYLEFNELLADKILRDAAK